METIIKKIKTGSLIETTHDYANFCAIKDTKKGVVVECYSSMFESPIFERRFFKGLKIKDFEKRTDWCNQLLTADAYEFARHLDYNHEYITMKICYR